MQSASRRRHSKARFRELSDPDTAQLLETRKRHRSTAPWVSSVVYATERRGENTSCTHPRDDGIVKSPLQLVARSLRLSGCSGVKSLLSSDAHHSQLRYVQTPVVAMPRPIIWRVN